MKKQVNMRVNQAGEQGTISQIDVFGSSGTRHRTSNLRNTFTLNQDLARLNQLARRNIQQARRMQNNVSGLRFLGTASHQQ
jgi:hypothetical protein